MNSAQSKKILIVDDDVTALDIVDFLFEEKGFAVQRYTDGVSALDSLIGAAASKTEWPDIVLIDLMMPQMNGQETVRKMRAAGLNAPVVAFTALDDPDIHQEALDAGCNLVLTKPCKPATLVAEISRLLAAG